MKLKLIIAKGTEQVTIDVPKVTAKSKSGDTYTTFRYREEYYTGIIAPALLLVQQKHSAVKSSF